MRVSFRALGVAVCAAVVLAGCEALDVKYVEATLEEALKQQVPSTTLRYRIPKPRIPVARQNEGIVRDGSLFVVIVGPDLHKVLRTYESDDVELGVRLVKEPKTHLILEAVFVDGEKIDLFEGQEGFRFQFPHLVTNQEIHFDSFPARPAGALGGLSAGKLQLTDLAVRKEKPSAELAEALGAAGVARPAGNHYFIGSPDGAVIVDGAEPVTLMMLDYLIAEEKEFTGGVRIEQVFDARTSQATHAVATANVRWIHLGGAMYYKVK